jgi:hypothetical protein
MVAHRLRRSSPGFRNRLLPSPLQTLSVPGMAQHSGLASDGGQSYNKIYKDPRNTKEKNLALLSSTAVLAGPIHFGRIRPSKMGMTGSESD